MTTLESMGTKGTTGIGNGTTLTQGYPCIAGNLWYHPQVKGTHA